MQRKFKARINSQGPGGAWSSLQIPFDVEKVWKTRARLSVKGTMNGFAFQTSIFPSGRGTHHMMVNKQMQVGSGAAPGDTVSIVLEPDLSRRRPAAPADLRRALSESPAALANFKSLAPSHVRAYVDWIASAKKPETRARRVSLAVEKLTAGKKWDEK